MKYLIIGLFAVLIGLPVCILLDAMIDLFEQWNDQEENSDA